MEPSFEAPFTLEGKAALVTGSGRGIGRAVAQKLAACGASVMLTDIDEAPVREAATETGKRAHWLVGDLTAPDFPQKLVGPPSAPLAHSTSSLTTPAMSGTTSSRK